MKITTCHLIQCPSGRWEFVGKVPLDLAFIDPTEEDIKNGNRFGARFGPKQRTFETKQDAINFAKSQGHDIEI